MINSNNNYNDAYWHVFVNSAQLQQEYKIDQKAIENYIEEIFKNTLQMEGSCSNLLKVQQSFIGVLNNRHITIENKKCLAGKIHTALQEKQGNSDSANQLIIAFQSSLVSYLQPPSKNEGKLEGESLSFPVKRNIYSAKEENKNAVLRKFDGSETVKLFENSEESFHLMLEQLEKSKMSNLSLSQLTNPLQTSFHVQCQTGSYQFNGIIWHYLCLKSSYFKSIENFKEAKEAEEKKIVLDDVNSEDFKTLIKAVFDLEELTTNNIYTLLELSSRFGFVEEEKKFQGWFHDFLIKQDGEDFLEIIQEKNIPFNALPIFKRVTPNFLTIFARTDKKQFISLVKSCTKKI